jgi:putative photosynthetic complex assembly protein
MKTFPTKHSQPSAHRDVPIVVRWILVGLGLLLVSVYWVRQNHTQTAEPESKPLWSKAFKFEDGSQGEIVVIDPKTKEVVATFEGEQGFLRGTLRALVRERKKRWIGPDEAFELSDFGNGAMVLSDPTTGESIYLSSFGPSNAMVFKKLEHNY